MLPGRRSTRLAGYRFNAAVCGPVAPTDARIASGNDAALRPAPPSAALTTRRQAAETTDFLQRSHRGIPVNAGFRLILLPRHNEAVAGRIGTSGDHHLTAIQVMLNGKTRQQRHPRFERTAAISIESRSKRGPMLICGLVIFDSANHGRREFACFDAAAETRPAAPRPPASARVRTAAAAAHRQNSLFEQILNLRPRRAKSSRIMAASYRG